MSSRSTSGRRGLATPGVRGRRSSRSPREDARPLDALAASRGQSPPAGEVLLLRVLVADLQREAAHRRLGWSTVVRAIPRSREDRGLLEGLLSRDRAAWPDASWISQVGVVVLAQAWRSLYDLLRDDLRRLVDEASGLHPDLVGPSVAVLRELAARGVRLPEEPSAGDAWVFLVGALRAEVDSRGHDWDAVLAAGQVSEAGRAALASGVVDLEALLLARSGAQVAACDEVRRVLARGAGS